MLEIVLLASSVNKSIIPKTNATCSLKDFPFLLKLNFLTKGKNCDNGKIEKSLKM